MNSPAARWPDFLLIVQHLKRKLVSSQGFNPRHCTMLTAPKRCAHSQGSTHVRAVAGDGGSGYKPYTLHAVDSTRALCAQSRIQPCARGGWRWWVRVQTLNSACG